MTESVPDARQEDSLEDVIRLGQAMMCDDVVNLNGGGDFFLLHDYQRYP